MANLLIRDIDPALKRQIAERARANRRSLSEEAEALMQQGIAAERRQVGVGTWLCSMVPDEWRGDDLVFECERRANRDD